MRVGSLAAAQDARAHGAAVRNLNHSHGRLTHGLYGHMCAKQSMHMWEYSVNRLHPWHPRVYTAVQLPHLNLEVQSSVVCDRNQPHQAAGLCHGVLATWCS
jgi:hypothetical protein